MGLLFEVLGVNYGIPFGKYSYSSVMPRLFGVQIMVPLFWFVITYTSFYLAVLLTSGRISLTTCFLTSLFSTAWDVILDPVMCNIIGAWHWESKGVFFDIPLSNYLGWLLVSFLISLTYKAMVERVSLKRFVSIIPIANYLTLYSALASVAFYKGKFEYSVAGAIAMFPVLILSCIKVWRGVSRGVKS